MMELTSADPLIKTYIREKQRLRQQDVVHELGLKGPFHNLLDKSARRRRWTLVPELSTYSGGKRVIPDGTVRDEYKLARGWWEAKDTNDNLANEIEKKRKLGYPTRNIIFEDTQTAVLFQDRSEAGEFSLEDPSQVAGLLNRFFSHDESDEREFERAMSEFKTNIPDLAHSLREHIQEAHKKTPAFKHAFADFLDLCRSSLNPEITADKVDEMIVQHLLTERLIRNLFQNPEFTKRNVIASEVEKVIEALASGSFSRAQFLQRLDQYYSAIERAGANLQHFTEKQDFLNSVYEQFFQKFSPDTADTHGIVYTPQEIVDFMCRSVEAALVDEFDLSLASPEVLILDPCTGTGNFVVNLMERMPGRALEQAYQQRLFANEVMLLPYYIASLNIEHAYYERKREYRTFDGLCFVDTLDMEAHGQIGLFTPANLDRVDREKKAAITVILGNPPYNVGQKSENDNNKNRKYKEVDERVRVTYGKSSSATNKNALADMYVKFFRWASDRLHGRDGIVCFVSNNSFVDQLAFDGMRKHLLMDFDHVDHVDLHGNVRRNPKISGTTHNVFGIQVGVGITIAVRKRGAKKRLRYHRVPEFWRRREKLEFLVKEAIPWEILAPNDDHTWLVPEHADEYREFIPIESMFNLWTSGVKTNRDDVVYDWDREKLAARMRKFTDDYNSEVYRHKANPSADWPGHVKWSRDLKQDVSRGRLVTFEEKRICESLYRPFSRRHLYLDRIFNEEIYQWENISGHTLVVSDVGWRAPCFGALMSRSIADLHLIAAIDAHQCFPLHHFKEETAQLFRKHYSEPSITREDIFHYLYAILHHPEYRNRYADNLKLELPRIPLASSFDVFADAGRELARLHLNYESLDPWPLQEFESKGVPYSPRITKMKLSEDRTSIKINESLTLAGIPEEVFEYRLGSRSALDWIIDQYQVKEDSDPNRDSDPEYIIRLVGQVVRVSVQTVRTVNSLPALK